MMIPGASTLLGDLEDRLGVETGEFGAELVGVAGSGVLDPASDPSRSSTAFAAAFSAAVFSLSACEVFSRLRGTPISNQVPDSWSF